MIEHIVKILRIGFVTHDTLSFIVEKPISYKFDSGQATTVGIKKEKNLQKRPITFSSTNNELILEFIIKKYPGGETEKIHKLNPGEELVINEPFGVMGYKGEGVFIAGGAGVTPFISILRELKKEGKIGKNKLLFSNKEAKDIILEKELNEILDKNLILNLTREKNPLYNHGRIDENYLKKHVGDFNQKFYICGPREFTTSVRKILESLGAEVDSITIEGGG